MRGIIMCNRCGLYTSNVEVRSRKFNACRCAKCDYDEFVVVVTEKGKPGARTKTVKVQP